MRSAPLTIFRRRASGGAASSSPSSPREERGGGPRRGETKKNAPPLPGPLLHPMEEREKSRSLMQPWASGGAWVSRSWWRAFRLAVFLLAALSRGAGFGEPPGSAGKAAGLSVVGAAGREGIREKDCS